MPSSDSSSFSPFVSLKQFQQLQESFQQAASELGAVVFTEATAASADVDRFILARSASFQALLTAQLQPQSVQAQAYRISLIFDPKSIAQFMQSIPLPAAEPPLPQPGLRHNHAQVQSEFMLRLTSALLNPLAEPEPTRPNELPASAALLHQQVAQERLLNQVATQIRRSLDLSVILQTAVDQVRQFLNADRLVIYQLVVTDFNSSTPSTMPLNGLPAPSSSPSTPAGAVIYEARSSNAIPSVLHFSDAHCFLPILRNQELRSHQLSLAVEDVATRYRDLPCLLQFLDKAQVKAKLVVPILVQDEVWGLLIAHDCTQARHWLESEQRFLQQVAEHLGIAIGQAQLYAELQHQKQTLERRVSEQTQELRDVMLAAQSANRAKSEFLTAVSHELRTPLTCIIGMSATLQRWSAETLNDRQRHFLQTIYDSGEHLLALINDILDLSQVEAGSMVLNLQEFSLTRLAQQALKTFEGKAALHNIELTLDLSVDTQNDRLTADPRRVQQIIYNLVDNAVKFTPEGGRVTLRLFLEDHFVTIQVKDTGIGIPEEQLPLLFQKFRQLDAGYQRQYEGTGLGLALTKQIVELHGGSINVNSTVGVGSVFTVRLPLSQPASGITRARVTPTPNPPKGRLILIERDEETANLICDILTAAGYQLVWMLEGSSAVNQIEMLRPSAVITNVQLPDLDGYNLIQCIRKNPATKHLKVIALVPEQTHRSTIWQDAGADDYLTQPVRPDHLLQKVMALKLNTIDYSAS